MRAYWGQEHLERVRSVLERWALAHWVRVHSAREHWERAHPRLAALGWALQSCRRHLRRKPILPLQQWPRVRSRWLDGPKVGGLALY